eukprot:CAMPEP_0202726140 /NCGR_PEP_ID=MMETSP1385-20130828/184460_1 /ASSEMBLY_ACC=CAM_ASM_000861 /TAXON_ID=933848 /ORGANISM="Elphidium margaritaceum" /LENGTH=467 /DNA_ID=CAMNT_0049392353 /DNA_START=34 /DNA_END=1437 /DNA_ORIENTATION=+
MDVESEVPRNNQENSNSSAAQNESKAATDIRYDVELTRSIKENHCTDIVDARWCPFKEGEAYVATVASNQLNVYHLEVRGNYMAVLINFRNWPLQTMRTKDVVWKEHLERNNLELLEKKKLRTVCWMKRVHDFWLAVADHEQQIQVVSMTYCKVLQIIKCEHNIIHLIAHPLYPNVLCAIDETHVCRFINTSNQEIIFTLPDEICKIEFNATGDRFVCVLMDGNIREYESSVVMLEAVASGASNPDDDDDDSKAANDGDALMTTGPRGCHRDRNAKNKGGGAQSTKRLVVNTVRTYPGTESKGGDIADIHYVADSQVVVLNERGHFAWIDLDDSCVVHEWRIQGSVDCDRVCRFDVNGQRDCLVYGNGDQTVQFYDLKKKKYLRKYELGLRRNFSFSFAAFCKHHPQSVMLVAHEYIMKFDPFELVQHKFPTTSDFAVQRRNGKNCFWNVHQVEYEVDKLQINAAQE